ncbi:unnamed protein product [Owenia fusiformis]|uniref:Uncharacterized protein n=1 Tax=Owenia fusiformis TaxID=6347 RepID=A0A8S4P2A2_OWEFU|nr:unnamed protein product [Owenia fusiformis]
MRIAQLAALFALVIFALAKHIEPEEVEVNDMQPEDVEKDDEKRASKVASPLMAKVSVATLDRTLGSMKESTLQNNLQVAANKFKVEEKASVARHTLTLDARPLFWVRRWRCFYCYKGWYSCHWRCLFCYYTYGYGYYWMPWNCSYCYVEGVSKWYWWMKTYNCWGNCYYRRY